MPKPYKTQPKPNTKRQPKAQPKKTPPKTKAKPVSLLKSKYYWFTLTLFILIFTATYGFLNNTPLLKELLILASILSVVALAFYVGFITKTGYSKRATFLFVGASVIGFSIWAATTLILSSMNLQTKIEDAAGLEFFAVTSLIICLAAGAFIGDLIGKNKDTITQFAAKLQK
ncbi:MAG: hypothetical protein NWE98_02465 [Candidatus Bathyarchaeota archaeon]|nr:hypothetical protein [Candidatus Bathyarchaeota archaeon]